MKINQTNNTLNFEAIKLPRKEANKIGMLMRNYSASPSKELSTQILDIFTPYLRDEAALKAGNKYSAADFLQEMYIKILESLKTLGSEDRSVTRLIQRLDFMTPGQDELISTADKQLHELSKKESFAYSYKFMNETPRDRIVELMQITKGINQKIATILNKYMDGYSIEEIADILCITPNRARDIKNKGITKMVVKLREIKARQRENWFKYNS